MKIAFDLDDTLIPTTTSFQCGVERGSFPFRLFYREPVRKGAKELLQDIAASHELWIYTTSLRPEYRVKLWFRGFNIKIAGVINTDIHNQVVNGTSYQKYSKA